MENDGTQSQDDFLVGWKNALDHTTTVYRPLLTNNMEAKHGDRWKMTFSRGWGVGSMLVFGGGVFVEGCLVSVLWEQFVQYLNGSVCC